jgi:cell division protein FtsW
MDRTTTVAPTRTDRPRTAPTPVSTHRSARARSFGLERSVVVVTLALVGVGVICVDTAVTPQAIANGGTIWGFMARDVILAGLGVAGFFLVRRCALARLARLAVPALVVSLGLLCAVEVSGSAASGGQRWLGVGSFTFQPSELFTLASCFYLAVVVARVERTSRNWIDILKWSLPVLAGVALIVKEPDLGTAAVLFLVTFSLFVLAGMPRRLIALCVAVAVSGLGIAAVAAPYRWARLMAFLHPSAAVSGAYQVVQAKIAIGSGQMTGLGFGQSRAKWGLLPNPHTDFIFAIVGEEFGFLGALAILGLFAWLLSVGVRVAHRAPDRESQLLAGAITLWFGIEVIINVASVVGWMPVTGIPLPLISYGGTSLVIDLLALGLLANVARRAGAVTPAVTATPMRPRGYPRGASRTPTLRDHRRSG